MASPARLFSPCKGVAPRLTMSTSKQRALKHQANDKLLPDIYTFLGWCATNSGEIVGLLAVKVLLSEKNQSIDHGNKNKILKNL